MLVGFYGGRYLDRLLGIDPWLSLVGIILGAVAGFRVLLRDIMRLAPSPGDKQKTDTADRREEGSNTPDRE